MQNNSVMFPLLTIKVHSLCGCETCRGTFCVCNTVKKMYILVWQENVISFCVQTYKCIRSNNTWKHNVTHCLLSFWEYRYQFNCSFKKTKIFLKLEPHVNRNWFGENRLFLLCLATSILLLPKYPESMFFWRHHNLSYAAFLPVSLMSLHISVSNLLLPR